MAQQWPHGAPDPIFPQNPPIWGQTILVPMPDGSYVPQTVPFGYQQPGQGFVGQPNPFGKPDPNVAYRPQGPPTPPAPALGPPTRPDVDVRGLAPRLGKERKFGLASQVQLRKGTAEDRTRHRRRPHMMLLLTEVDEAVPPSGANRDRDFLQKANWGRQEIEEEDPYYVEATNFPVVQQAVGRIYLDRTSASFLEWSWAMAEEQEQLNTALGAIVSGSGHLETKYANEKPENYAFLADMAEKYIDVRLRAVGSMQNRERDVWCVPERTAALAVLYNYPQPLSQHRWDTRNVMIGNLVHGGDLEADAILCNASGGAAITAYQGALELRHGRHFNDYFLAAFPAYYFTLTKEAALWLVLWARGPPVGRDTLEFINAVKFFNFATSHVGTNIERHFKPSGQSPLPQRTLQDKTRLLLPAIQAMVDYAAQWNTLYNDHGPQLPSDKNASAPLLKITDRNDLARLRQNAYFAITRLPLWTILNTTQRTHVAPGYQLWPPAEHLDLQR